MKKEINGKNFNRAYRRYQQKVILKRRAELWWHREGDGGAYVGKDFFGKDTSSRGKFVDDVMKGKRCTFLKWSAKPCSCSGCSYLKYEREPKWKWLQNENKFDS